MTMIITAPVSCTKRRGFMVAGRSRAFGASSYPLITAMAFNNPEIVAYIKSYGGIHVPALARAMGWTEGRVRGVIQSGLKAANPTIELGPHHSLPFRRSAQSYRLTVHGQALARAIDDRQMKELNQEGEQHGE